VVVKLWIYDLKIKAQSMDITAGYDFKQEPTLTITIGYLCNIGKG
jgi:hypothetical protein